MTDHRQCRSAELLAKIAAHEAGHALGARLLGSAIEYVSIKPSNGYEGVCVRRGAESSLNLLAPDMRAIDIIQTAERIGVPQPRRKAHLDCRRSRARDGPDH